ADLATRGPVQAGAARPEILRVLGALRHRADRRAARAHGAAPIDGDGGGDRIERVDRGAREALEELPRVRAEALHVAALPFGVERAEGEGRLARAARARDDDELAGREIEIDALEVVGPSSAEPCGSHGAQSFTGVAGGKARGSARARMRLILAQGGDPVSEEAPPRGE